jgi:hypothetical protein
MAIVGRPVPVDARSARRLARTVCLRDKAWRAGRGGRDEMTDSDLLRTNSEVMLARGAY